MGYKYLIVGSGMQGTACAFDLLRSPGTEEVLLADSSAAGLDAARRRLKSRRLRTVRADASDLRRVRALAKGRDVQVSAVPYYFNLGLAKAAVDAKVHHVDLGGNTDIVLQELALSSKAKAAGVTLIPDAGLGPGMTNTIAVEAMGRLDEVSEVLIRDGGLPQDPAPPMDYLLTFSEHGLINEYVEDATALRGGRRVKVPGLSEVEEISLPGLGRMEAAHASGGLSTMAWTYQGKVRSMDNKLIRYPGHIAVINAMRAMGFFRTAPMDLGGAKVAPRTLSARLFREAFHHPGEKDFVVIRVTARGRKDGRRAEAVYDGMDRYDEKEKMTAMMRTTGFPASITAQMLASGFIAKPGAYPVETAVPPGPFLDEMRRRGLKLRWKVRTLDDSN